MSNKNLRFNDDCSLAFDEEHWQKINYNTGCYEKRFANSQENYRNVELEKQRAYLLRNKSLMNIEKLLVDFETHFKDHGGQVLWARDVDDAQEMIWDLVNKRDIHGITRSNSVVLDEIGLDDFLAEKNVKLYESSVSRYILKAMGNPPYHPVYPTMNLSAEEINGILHEHYKLKPYSTPKQMVNFIRHQVNQQLAKAQVCITGANFLLSDVGGVVMTENEGNILKSCAAAKIHIVVAGIEKVVPSIEDLSILLPLSSAHAIGHGMTSINSITTGPSNGKGPEQMVVILLNNGRSELLGNEIIRQSLSCIHCGACISVCPIYKNIGGYAYGTPYIGPIGTVMTPLMYGLEKNQHLTSLCSLCGRCTEVCPVKIPMDDLIIENRRLVASERIGNAKFEALVKTMIGHCKSRKKMDCAQWLKKMEIKQLVSKSAFTKRTMPELAPKSFNQQTEK
jgi:L-lactate dehydrogenase complex protein LldF